MTSLLLYALCSQDEDNQVFKRDFAKPTLEDHFDKTVLPKVMQVCVVYVVGYVCVCLSCGVCVLCIRSSILSLWLHHIHIHFLCQQVKNFGRSGRTKYTHLVDQDTTVFDSAWTESTPLNLKFQTKGGGARQIFDKPSYKKRKMM